MTSSDMMDSFALARLRAAGVWHDEPEVLRFLAAVAGAAAGSFTRRVVELGSHRMHDHNPTATFPNAHWIGVDWRPGPGVDVVGLAHDIAAHGVDFADLGHPSVLPGDVDVVLSISALEHDPHWRLTLAAAVALVRPGGLVAMTCAGPEWGEHEHDCAPGGARHYRNVDCDEAVEVIRLAATARRLRTKTVAWYETRTYAPHWPRTCVLAWVG